MTVLKVGPRIINIGVYRNLSSPAAVQTELKPAVIEDRGHAPQIGSQGIEVNTHRFASTIGDEAIDSAGGPMLVGD